MDVSSAVTVVGGKQPMEQDASLRDSVPLAAV